MVGVSSDAHREPLLDAALAVVSRHGLKRFSMDDVARHAGLSRPTLYRCFGSRDELLRALLLREEDRLATRVWDAAGGSGELRPALEVLIAETLRAVRAHPLLDRLLEAESEALLPLLLGGGGPVLSAAEPMARRMLEQWMPHLSPVELDRTADVMTRLLVSYGLNPPTEEIEAVAAGLAELLVNGLKGI